MGGRGHDLPTSSSRSLSRDVAVVTDFWRESAKTVIPHLQFCALAFHKQWQDRTTRMRALKPPIIALRLKRSDKNWTNFGPVITGGGIASAAVEKLLKNY